MSSARSPRFLVSRRVLGALVLAGAAASALAGCTAEDPAHGNPVAVFEVAGVETYRIELATPALVEQAEDLLADGGAGLIPLGTVVRDDPGPNAPWSWHIDPATLEFAQIAIEVCDGIPSFVEDATVTSDQYCPWSAVLIDIEE